HRVESHASGSRGGLLLGLERVMAPKWPDRVHFGSQRVGRCAIAAFTFMLLLAGCASFTTVPVDLVDKTLDAAYSECSQLGIDCTYVTNNGQDVWLQSDWGVCETQPAGGQPLNG